MLLLQKILHRYYNDFEGLHSLVTVVEGVTLASFDQSELELTAGALDARGIFVVYSLSVNGGRVRIAGCTGNIPCSAHAQTLTFTTWVLLFASCPYKEGEKVSVLR